MTEYEKADGDQAKFCRHCREPLGEFHRISCPLYEDGALLIDEEDCIETVQANACVDEICGDCKQ